VVEVAARMACRPLHKYKLCRSVNISHRCNFING
jgi:hypothetical protein